MKIPAPLLPALSRLALSRLALCATIMPAHSQAKPNNPPLREEYRDQTLPALMKAAGYRTGIIGKLHVNPKSTFPFDLSLNAKLGPNGAREIRAMADAAGEFIAADPSKPFFLMMSYVDPHHPFAAQMFGLPEKPTLPGEVPPWPFQQVENDTLLEQAANYYNCVRRLDIGVGMLMEKLKAAGKDENTVTIFLGDHGPPFSRAKTTCYEAGLHVPFLLRWPIRRSGNFTISRPTRGSSTTSPPTPPTPPP